MPEPSGQPISRNIAVNTVISTPSTSVLRVADLVELLAACRLHGVDSDGEVVCQISPNSNEHVTYFSLVASARVAS